MNRAKSQTSVPPPGIDAEAWNFVTERMRLNSKTDRQQVCQALSGLNGPDVIEVVGEWLSRSGLPRLKVNHLMEICGWLRNYSVRLIFKGFARAFKTADQLGHAIFGPGYVTPHISQLAGSSTERALRTGGR